jgi:16S rRNA G966 N2-methylase RsmD
MFYYLGRKQRIAHLYPEPVYDRIIEPFAGSGAYSLHGDRWQRDVTLIELDPGTCAAWRYLLEATSTDVLSLPDMNPGDRLSDHDQLSEGEQWLIRFHINPGASQRSNVVTRFTRWNGAKRRIANSLHKVKHWNLIEGDYRFALDVEATWFIDPPYHRSGRFYMTNDVDYNELGAWCQSRRGQVMVCEQDGADWLPFAPLAEERAARGGKTSEVIYIAM